MSVRVHELAHELQISAKSVLEKLAGLGIYVKSPSSIVQSDDARRLRDSMGQPSAEFVAQASATSKPASWMAGAIRPTQRPEALANLNKLKAAFPIAADHQQALSKLGSQFVFAGQCRIASSDQCFFGLIRFSGAIENAFGLTREVLFFYSPYRDFQIRTVRAAKETISRLPREVTPDIVFFYAPDVRLREKLEDWSRGDFLAIPLTSSFDESATEFVSLLRDFIFARDLFYETTPVHGDRFFGRRRLLQELRDDVKNQRVAGVFGLRKAGKTSVLSELSNTLASDTTVVILRDLESLPSPPLDPVPDLLRSLVEVLLDELRGRKLRTQELSNLTSASTLADFKSALQATLRKIERSGVRIVILLDEIEYLTPSDRVDIVEGDLTSVAQFLGILRSLVQENPNFTFLLSGLTSAIVESGRLYGRPNPLFSWAKANFLSPFERQEADELAKTVSQKMGITIEDGALESLYEASGGHAFLYRHLASHVVSCLPVDVYHRRMIRADVLRATQAWKLDIAGNMREMLDHVKRYYPEESFLLEVLRDEPGEFMPFANAAPSALGHLLGLGLVQQDGHGYELTPVLHLL